MDARYARDFAQLGLRGKGKWSTRTYHQGANDERTAVLAKVRRELKRSGTADDAETVLAELEKWLLTRNERYKKNPGGL